MKTIRELCEYREEIKKSRFICLAKPVHTIDEAMAFFDEYSDPQARHNCWAYKVGNDYRFNDDGEPSGTAGRPILSAIEYAELTNVAILVLRWFGGVKLGTGGLCRAYGGSAAQCLKLAEEVEIFKMKKFSFRTSFEQAALVHRLLDGAQVNEEYDEKGIYWSLELEEKKAEQFCKSLSELSRGQITFEEIEDD